MTSVAKGNYYRNRTREWLESLGDDYVVEVAEVSQRIVVKDKTATDGLRVLYRKRDLWGADLVARNADHIIFVQVKSNKADIAAGVKQLSRGPWPPWVGRWVVWWPPRRQLKKGPDIEVVA